MEIHLSEDLERFVDDQVRAGRFSSKDQMVEAALKLFKQGDGDEETPTIDPSLGSLGAMRDDAELLDKIVEEAMRARETRRWRLPVSE
jgi:putative addiction module CopG family antidote